MLRSGYDFRIAGDQSFLNHLVHVHTCRERERERKKRRHRISYIDIEYRYGLNEMTKMINMLATMQPWQASDAKILEAALWSSYVLLL